MYQTQNFEIFPVSSLEKVRATIRPCLFEEENTALLGERFSFQVAYRSIGITLTDLVYDLQGVPQECAQVFLVREVPCSYAVAENSDDYNLTDKPCMMPDLLTVVPVSGITASCGMWRSFYIVLQGLQAGVYDIHFSVRDNGGVLLGSVDYRLRVVDQRLPESDLLCTYWIHCDSLADYYKLPVFSDAYYKILRSYVSSAVGYGMNMLLTPLFTPPLDTEQGKERMTVQLVDVTVKNGCYLFGFERLGEFMRLAEECGVKYFEMSHLFTQWGAKFAPKIVADFYGKKKRILGWDTPALSQEYKDFLSAFLPQLRDWLKQNGYYERCFFHISDEPGSDAIEHYRACRSFVDRFLPDAKFIDAMSHYEFYHQKAVDYPFVALNATEAFIKEGVKNYFVYYCTTQRNQFYSNRFLSLPQERTRVLGMQIYRNGAKGFLHWGFNYYYSFLSREPIDPYIVTDCMGRYQSGDAFTVYPGKSGALGSLRGEAFYAGLQDYRALLLLEQKIGKEKVCSFLQKNGLENNYSNYPKNALWLINLRKKINRIISEFVEADTLKKVNQSDNKFDYKFSDDERI